jgi:hypothetical protein
MSGEVMPELSAWMEAHHNPKWKFKPYSAPKAAKLKPKRGKEFSADAIKYEYSQNNDYRTIVEPVGLEQFMTVKHDRKWKVPGIKFSRIPTTTHLGFGQEDEARKWVREYVNRCNAERLGAVA